MAQVALSPSGRYLYTADGGANRVSVIDTRSKRVVTSVPVGSQPLSVAVSPDGGTLYTANGPSNDVSLVDLAAKQIVKKITAGNRPWGVAIISR